MQAHGCQHYVARRGVFPGQPRLALEDFHAQQTVIAGFPIPEGVIAQILLEAGQIMIERGQKTGAGQRRLEFLVQHNPRAIFRTAAVCADFRSRGAGSWRSLARSRCGIRRKPLLVQADVRIHAFCVRRAFA